MTALTAFITRAGLSNVDGLERPFTYLAGPMSRQPHYGFPEFDRVARILRADDFNIISPAELDDAAERDRILTSCPTGTEPTGKPYEDCLRRDATVMLHPNCQGVIVLPGWERSTGARMETYIADTLRLPIDAYRDTDLGYQLRRIDRATALRWAGA